MRDTIFAFSSGEGRAAVAVFRISGPHAADVLKAFGCGQLVARRAALVLLKDPADGSVLDQALAIWFPGPHSFTGEDCLEFHVHGGRAVRRAIARALLNSRLCRMAEPGEFTRRAFVNGKFGLTELEALGDLIDANTELQRRQALRGYCGLLGDRANSWRGTILDCLALVEAYIDFSDEGDAPVDVRSEMRDRLSALIDDFDKALAGGSVGEMIRGGARVVLVGAPNAGKSSLLNAIAKRDVAIVSAQPGTTRDLIEVYVDLDGLEVVFIDTAGMRHTADEVEAMGIDRARTAMAEADLIVALEASDSAEHFDFRAIGSQLRVIKIVTKNDLLNFDENRSNGNLAISAKTGDGISQFLSIVRDSLLRSSDMEEDVIITNERQLACVKAARLEVAALVARLEHIAPELLSEHLRHRCLTW